jgi:hypothetical protein
VCVLHVVAERRLQITIVCRRLEGHGARTALATCSTWSEKDSRRVCGTLGEFERSHVARHLTNNQQRHSPAPQRSMGATEREYGIPAHLKLL